MAPKKKAKRMFDIHIFPMAEKMWIDQEFSGIEAENEEQAIRAVMERAAKAVRARLLEIVNDKTGRRICKATVHVAEVVGEKQDEVLEAKEFEWNL